MASLGLVSALLMLLWYIGAWKPYLQCRQRDAQGEGAEDAERKRPCTSGWASWLWSKIQLFRDSLKKKRFVDGRAPIRDYAKIVIGETSNSSLANRHPVRFDLCHPDLSSAWVRRAMLTCVALLLQATIRLCRTSTPRIPCSGSRRSRASGSTPPSSGTSPSPSLAHALPSPSHPPTLWLAVMLSSSDSLTLHSPSFPLLASSPRLRVSSRADVFAVPGVSCLASNRECQVLWTLCCPWLQCPTLTTGRCPAVSYHTILIICALFPLFIAFLFAIPSLILVLRRQTSSHRFKQVLLRLPCIVPLRVGVC